jgi:hypothetical protein
MLEAGMVSRRTGGWLMMPRVAVAGRVVAWVGLAGALVVAPGCFVARSGEGERRVDVAPLADSVWETLPGAGGGAWSSAADDADAGDLAALHERTLEAFADEGWQHKGDRLRERRLVYGGLAAGGLLRVVDDRSLGGQAIDEQLVLGWIEEFVTGFKPNATFLSERELARQRERRRIVAQVEREEAAAAALRTQASGPPASEAAPGAGHGSVDAEGDGEASASGGEGVSSEDGLLLSAGVDVGVPLEAAPDSKGVMVHLPALMGTKYEARAVQRLRDLGWTVLHVRGPTGVRPPNDLARHEADSRRSARTRLRLREQGEVQFEEYSFAWDPHSGDLDLLPGGAEYAEIAEAVRGEIPMPPTGLEAQPGESPIVVAQRIAAAADTGLAEAALAAEAGLAALLELHPHLRGRPVVVIGFSAGAIGAPAVAVRLAERVDAVVLIGGGADGLTVSQTSSVTRGGAKLAPADGPELSPEFIEEVRAAYRELSQLDPYNAAPRLGRVPVLQVMARGDGMVQTEHQWTLWDRLGRPDRITWHGPLGHQGLFYLLAGQMGRIDRWVMRQVGEGRAPARQ